MWTTAATIDLVVVVVVVVDVVFLAPIVAHVAVSDERLPLAPHKFVASGHFRVATRVVERPCQEEEQNRDQPVLLCSTATLFSLTKANKTEASILSLQTLNVCLDWIEDAITRTGLCLTLVDEIERVYDEGSLFRLLVTTLIIGYPEPWIPLAAKDGRA